MRLIAFLLLAMTAAAHAQEAAIPVPAAVKTAATGNLPPDFYPRSSCRKPDGKFLKKPPTSQDIAAYNKKVQAYNHAAHTFNLCVTAYTAQAQRDMEVIREAVNAANGD